MVIPPVFPITFTTRHNGYGVDGARPTRPRHTTWYIPKTREDAVAFQQGKDDIKNFLVTNKEGVNTTRIINFLADEGITIPYEKFGLSFNEFLFHCKDFLQLDAHTADAETRHLLSLVQGQMTEKKKKPGLPRPTFGNTMYIDASTLLHAPAPFIFTDTPRFPSRGRGPGSPTHSRRHLDFNSPSGRGGSGSTYSTMQASMPPYVSSRGDSGNVPMVPFAPSWPVTVPTAAPVCPPAADTVMPSRTPTTSIPTPTSNGFVPSVEVKHPGAFMDIYRNSSLLPVSASSVLPPPAPMVLCGGFGADMTDHSGQQKPEILSPLADTKMTKVTSQNPGAQQRGIQTVQPTIWKPPMQPSMVSGNIPDGFVHPLKACPVYFNLESLKKRMDAESFGDRTNLLSLTVTGFKVGEPGTFYIRLKELRGDVSRLELMMKTYYEFRPENQPKVTRQEMIINGIYGGFDRERNMWHRVQVVKVKEGETERPFTVFLIDHGKFLDMDCGDIRYLKEFHSNGLMRHAYYASFAYMPAERQMLTDATHFLMRLSTGKDFLTYMHKVEPREDGPRLLLRFAMNLANVGINGTKIHPTGIVY